MYFDSTRTTGMWIKPIMINTTTVSTYLRGCEMMREAQSVWTSICMLIPVRFMYALISLFSFGKWVQKRHYHLNIKDDITVNLELYLYNVYICFVYVHGHKWT